jgi:hypothetical protein
MGRCQTFPWCCVGDENANNMRYEYKRTVWKRSRQIREDILEEELSHSLSRQTLDRRGLGRGWVRPQLWSRRDYVVIRSPTRLFAFNDHLRP